MQMAFTLICSEANSLANDFVKLRPAERITEVGKEQAAGALPPPILALIMQPPPLYLINGITNLDNLTADITLR